jgi:hypothetical protein
MNYNRNKPLSTTGEKAITVVAAVLFGLMFLAFASLLVWIILSAWKGIFNG